MAVRYKYFDDAELTAFRRFQRRSFDTLEQVASQLRAGMTERQAARLVRKRFHEQGVHTYFHVPVALFGERTAYPGQFGQLEALATDRALAPGEPVILDAAPIYDGYVVDTSLSTAFGDNELHRRLHPALQGLREQILREVRAGLTFRQIERNADAAIQALGAENCHRKHIGEVLGHRVYRAPNRPWNRLTVRQLSVRHAAWLLWKSVAALKGWQDDSPNWNHRRTSDHRPFPGLWAVEPHFAVDGVGVKFEEISVITDRDAYWLDDDVPHVRAWRSGAGHGLGGASPQRRA
ncbi:MAG: M24 family metallopeptidase [Haliangiales bacterium]